MRLLNLESSGKYTLLLAGEGPLKEEIMEYAKGLPVYFLGSIDDVPEKMMAADIFLQPSLNEGLPTVVLEAQASGLPCYISNQITKEAGITDLVKYLPLQEDIWVKEIEKKALSGTCQNERLIYGKIVEKTNSIEQTKAAILTLYLEDTLCKKRIDYALFVIFAVIFFSPSIPMFFFIEGALSLGGFGFMTV